jgi:hypothetical protein
VSEKKVILPGGDPREADLAACLRGAAATAGTVKMGSAPQSGIDLAQNCART